MGAQDRGECLALPLPSGDLLAAADNGVTNPALLNTLVKVKPWPATQHPSLPRPCLAAAKELLAPWQPAVLTHHPPLRRTPPRLRCTAHVLGQQEVDESRVFPDSKTIVDMPLKAPPEEVAAAFARRKLPDDPEQRNQTLADFVETAGLAAAAPGCMPVCRRHVSAASRIVQSPQ